MEQVTCRKLIELLQALPEDKLDRAVKVFVYGKGEQESFGTVHEVFLWDHDAEDGDQVNDLGTMWDHDEDVDPMDDVILKAW